ncbi:MAG: chemotaxis protein CheW [Bacteroidales bacterium]|jgi:chemotaxis signal transduction protein|nr:chemotaxis protein CheW [Bacteroidales bacterium]
MFRENILQPKLYLTYKISGEVYASSSNEVRKILDVNSISDSGVDGLGNFAVVDNKEIPILNLTERLSLNDNNSNYSSNKSVVVLKIGLRETYSLIGILVEEVIELIDIDLNQISTSPLVEDLSHNDYIEGLYSYKKTTIKLLNIRKLINTDDSIVIRTWNKKRKLVLIN